MLRILRTKRKLLQQFSAAIIAAILLSAVLPMTVLAANNPTLIFDTIRTGESVTVNGRNFPRNTEFTVRMGIRGTYAIDGTIVGHVNSNDGTFTATFTIPAHLSNEETVAIRFDSSAGWYSYSWFTNQKTSAVIMPETNDKPYIKIIGVDANDKVTVQAHRFPPNETFKVRVGPFESFFKDYVVADTIYSGDGGSFKFTIDLPTNVIGVDLVTVRLDSPSKQYAYNAFKNVDSGNIQPDPDPLPPEQQICEVLSTSQTKKSLNRWENFDVVWKVKNTGTTSWKENAVDYTFVSGTQMHKYNNRYDFTQTVEPGETVTIRVDMLAPAVPGTYVTNWAIVQGDTTLCSLPFSTYVK